MTLKTLLAATGLLAVSLSHAQTAQFQTSEGNFSVELNAKAAPTTVANFIRYANARHYDGTIFHRVMNNFMIQGGGFDTSMREKATNPPIANEAANGLKNERYTIAMARTGDPHSATAQFFINVKTNDFLNHRAKTIDGWGYTVFGKVTSGFEVVDKIKGAYTKTVGAYENVPIRPIVITSVRIVP
ncbi:MAG: peptidylprolyl isomerase [Formosimonas sp.]